MGFLLIYFDCRCYVKCSFNEGSTKMKMKIESE